MWLIALATTQVFTVFSLPFFIAIAIALGLFGLAILWQRGRRIEAVSLLNTVLLIIIIILLLLLH
jgi:hypothetical protein